MRSPAVVLRPAHVADVAAIADIWRRGWSDGHLGGVPDELVAARTPGYFSRRAADRLSDATVGIVDGEVAGFVVVVDSEVEQVYVASEQRGRGVAAVLLAKAERQIASAGHPEAWLAVVASNRRARAFYEKSGWIDRGRFTYQAFGESGPIGVPAHRYTKAVRSVPGPGG